MLGGGDEDDFLYCIPDLGTVAKEFSGMGSVHAN